MIACKRLSSKANYIKERFSLILIVQSFHILNLYFELCKIMVQTEHFTKCLSAVICTQNIGSSKRLFLDRFGRSKRIIFFVTSYPDQYTPRANIKNSEQTVDKICSFV